MGRGMLMMFGCVLALVFVLGCASPSGQLKGNEKLEAKEWLHAGDLSYQVKDWDNAQYYYELAINKYPDSYYGKKAKENLGYVNYQKSLIGKAIRKGTEALEPVF